MLTFKKSEALHLLTLTPAYLTSFSPSPFLILQNPNPGIRALPSPSNLLEWHYVLEGDKESDYAGGYYHGKITFPQTYPFKPPSIMMITPSGRFEPGAKICLSISDFHPESWNPLWGVSMILLGLQSFFYETSSTTGALHNVSAAEKRRLASQSLEFNARNMTYRKLFPDLIRLAREREKANAEMEGSAAAAVKLKGKSNKKESAANLRVGPGGVPQEDQEGVAEGVAAEHLRRNGGGGDGGMGGEVPKPALGARELFFGAAAVFIALGMAFVALERF